MNFMVHHTIQRTEKHVTLVKDRQNFTVGGTVCQRGCVWICFLLAYLTPVIIRNLKITHNMKKIKFQYLFISAWRLFSYKLAYLYKEVKALKPRQMASSDV